MTIRFHSSAKAVLILQLLVLGACGPAPSEPALTWSTPLTTILEFEGVVDPDTGRVELHPVGGSSLQASADATAEQALVVLDRDTNGVVGTGTAANSVEVIVECNGVPLASCPAPFATPRGVTNGCGNGVNSFEFDVTVRSFFPAGLRAVYAQVTGIDNPSQPPGANAVCTNDPPTRNLSIDGSALQGGLGLIRYGHLEPDTNGPALTGPARVSDSARWRFRNPGGQFRFNARILAEVCVGSCRLGTDGSGGSSSPATSELWSTEGSNSNPHVFAAAESTGRIFMGGDFTYVGPRTGASAELGAIGAADAGRTRVPWPQIEGVVHDVVPDGAGGAYVGGEFTLVVGATTFRNLLHVLPSGAADTAFTGNVTGGSQSVRTLLLDSGVLFVGGSFTSINGSARTNIAALNPSSGAVLAFSATPSTLVTDIQADTTTLFIVGNFNTVNGAAAVRVARLDRTSGALVAFPVTANAIVNGVAVDAVAGRLYVVGQFNTLTGANGSFTRLRMGAFDIATGNVSTTWVPAAGAEVRTVVRSGSAVFVGGDSTFTTTPSTTTRQRVAAYDSTNGSLLPFNASLPSDGSVRALSVADSVLYLGGVFTSASNLRAFNATTGGALTYALMGPNEGATTIVRSVSTGGDSVFVGGEFRSVGGIARSGLAAVELVSGVADVVNPAAQPTVTRALLGLPDGSVWAGGDGRLVRLSAAGALLADVPVTGSVQALAVDGNGIVYAAGNFTELGGASRQNLAALQNDVVSAFSPAGVPVVNGITTNAVGVFVATATGISQFSFVGALLDSWPANAPVRGISASRDAVFAIGSFSTVDGVAAANIVRLERPITVSGTNGVQAANFDVVSTAALALDGPGNTITAVGNSLYIGGTFSTSATFGCQRGCAIHARGGGLGAINFRASSAVTTTAVAGEVVLLGGIARSSSISGVRTTGHLVIFAE